MVHTRCPLRAARLQTRTPTLTPTPTPTLSLPLSLTLSLPLSLPLTRRARRGRVGLQLQRQRRLVGGGTVGWVRGGCHDEP